MHVETDDKTDSASDGNQRVIDFDTVLKDDHHAVPMYQHLAMEEIYLSGHEAEVESVAVGRGLESVNENIC